MGCRSSLLARTRWMKQPAANSRSMCVWVSRAVQVGREIMAVGRAHMRVNLLMAVACLVPCLAQMASVTETRLWTDMRA